jgi:hypothetical protein
MTSRANDLDDFNSHNPHEFSGLPSPRVVSAAGGDGEALPRLAEADRGPLPILANAAQEMAERVRAGEVSFTDAVDYCHSAALAGGLPDDSALQFVLAQAFGTVPGVLSSAMGGRVE